MDTKLFNKMIFDWTMEFGFKVDGDYILIGGANVNGFIMELDKQFEEWKNKEKSKDGKKYASK